MFWVRIQARMEDRKFGRPSSKNLLSKTEICTHLMLRMLTVDIWHIKVQNAGFTKERLMIRIRILITRPAHSTLLFWETTI